MRDRKILSEVQLLHTKLLHQISTFNDALVVSSLAEFVFQHEKSVVLNLCSCHQRSFATMDFPGDSSNPAFSPAETSEPSEAGGGLFSAPHSPACDWFPF